MWLDGKTGIVTGAGRGIGRAAAQLLAEQGARILAADLDEKSLAETAASIVAAGGKRTRSRAT